MAPVFLFIPQGVQYYMLDPVTVPVELSVKPQVVISDLRPGLAYEFKVKRRQTFTGYNVNNIMVNWEPHY